MKRFTIVLLALFLSGIVSAQTDTLVNFYRTKAVNYQQRVKMAENKLSGAESKVDASKSAQLPSLDFKGNYDYFGVDLQMAPPADGSSPNGQAINNIYALRLELYQPILTGGHIKGQKLVAQSEVEMMKSLVVMNKQQVVLNSDMFYWDAVAKKEIYTLLTKYKEVIGSFLKVINDRVEEEIVGKNELYQAKVRYNDAEYQAIRSEKEYMVSIMNLNKLAGMPLNAPGKIADTLGIPLWQTGGDSLIQKALTQRPELSYAESQVMRNESVEKLSGSKYNPQFGVLAGTKWGSPAPGLQLDPDFQYYIKAQLVIPIFHWGKKNEEVMVQKHETEIAKLQMQETRDNVALQVESSYYKLMRSQEQLNFSRSALENAQQNVSVMLDRYKEGLSSVLEVLDAQLYWQKSYHNYIIAKYELNIAYSQYLFAVGEFAKL
jgi:outer membrane protein TolC